MSSNIHIKRICQHCGKEFIARTTVTKYCGDDCSKRAYKARIKHDKIKASNEETIAIKSLPLVAVNEKEYNADSEKHNISHGTDDLNFVASIYDA